MCPLPVDAEDTVFVFELGNAARRKVTCCLQITAVLKQRMSLFAMERLCTLQGQPRLEAVCCDTPGRSLDQIKNSLFVFGEGSPSLFQGNLL